MCWAGGHSPSGAGVIPKLFQQDRAQTEGRMWALLWPSPSPWLPKKPGTEDEPGNIPRHPRPQGLWNLLGSSPNLTSPRDAESQKSSGRNLDVCQFYLFLSKFVAKPAQSHAWNKAMDEPQRAERSRIKAGHMLCCANCSQHVQRQLSPWDLIRQV